jgi:sugar phosphate isomerase/epimerase
MAMKVGASTFYNFLKKSPAEICGELQKNGIDTVEVMYEYPHLISEDDAKKLRKLGLDYSVHGPFAERCFVHPHTEFRKFQAKMVEKSLDIAGKIGADRYVMHGGLIPTFYSMLESPISKEDFRGIFVKEFEEMFAEADDSGVKVLVENLGAPGQIGKYADIAYLQKRMPFLGFCFDLSHAAMNEKADVRIDEYIKSMKIDHVHITDSVPGDDKHWAIGKGQLPIKETLHKLKNKGYDGKVIFEGLTLKDTLESVKKLREMVG